MATDQNFRRILLKLSGEGLMGDREFGLDPDTVERICQEISGVHADGVQVCLVIGAGNIFRGVSGAAAGIERTSADYMGMLATVINALALQDLLESKGVPTRVLTAIPMRSVAEPYIRRRAMRHLEKGRVVIFAGGTGQPYFSTDTTAALRGAEIGADVLLKGTQVDGIYDKDPNQHDDAVRFEALSFAEVIQKDLKVMDKTAFTMCEQNGLPIVVFEMGVPGNLTRILKGDALGTTVGA